MYRIQYNRLNPVPRLRLKLPERATWTRACHCHHSHNSLRVMNAQRHVLLVHWRDTFWRVRESPCALAFSPTARPSSLLLLLLVLLALTSIISVQNLMQGSSVVTCVRLVFRLTFDIRRALLVSILGILRAFSGHSKSLGMYLVAQMLGLTYGCVQ